MDLAMWKAKYPGWFCARKTLPLLMSVLAAPQGDIPYFRAWSYTLKFPKYGQLTGRKDLLLHKIMTA